MTNAEKNEATVGELLSALARDTGVLVRQEVQLAASEMTAKAKIAVRNTALVVAGGALIHAGLLALIIAGVVGLETVLPLWLSAVILGVAVMSAGFAFVQKGLGALRRLDAIPGQALGTLKADVVWAKEQLR